LRSFARKPLVFAVDATASREKAWDASKRVTDALLTALPGELDVALAVFGGSKVHTFSPFFTSSDAGKLRDMAADVRRIAGSTRLLDILGRVAKLDVAVVIYIGDCYEESVQRAQRSPMSWGGAERASSSA
jgi:hypothetical protein